jgi:hypothetical protein
MVLADLTKRGCKSIKVPVVRPFGYLQKLPSLVMPREHPMSWNKVLERAIGDALRNSSALSPGSLLWREGFTFTACSFRRSPYD